MHLFEITGDLTPGHRRDLWLSNDGWRSGVCDEIANIPQPLISVLFMALSQDALTCTANLSSQLPLLCGCVGMTPYLHATPLLCSCCVLFAF